MFIGFFCSSSFKDLLDISKKRNLNFGQNNMRIFSDSFIKIGDIMMCILVVILICLVLCCLIPLMCGQIYLIKRNITNIENDAFQGKESTNPFYTYQNRWFAIKTVLGLTQKWKWFFPIVEPNIYNGGYVFDNSYINNNIF
jgi:hypothetical protein